MVDLDRRRIEGDGAALDIAWDEDGGCSVGKTSGFEVSCLRKHMRGKRKPDQKNIIFCGFVVLRVTVHADAETRQFFAYLPTKPPAGGVCQMGHCMVSFATPVVSTMFVSCIAVDGLAALSFFALSSGSLAAGQAAASIPGASKISHSCRWPFGSSNSQQVL